MKVSGKRLFQLSLGLVFASLFLLALSSCGGESTSAAAPEKKLSTLEIVKQRGTLVLGVTSGVPGYSAPDSAGKWQGFDVDLGRAVAAAIFGDPDKVEYRPLSAKERFTALQSGEIDILSRVTTWTMSRDTTLGLNFAGVNYYDGQGFLVRKDSGITSVKELNGASISVQSGTTTELNLSDYFRKNGLQYELITFEKNEQAAAALENGRADAVTSDQSQLYALRTKFKNPDDYIMLPEVISKEPLGPVVRQGDDQWMDLVRWTLLAMVNAEEAGVTSQNIDEIKASTDNPDVKRLLGLDGEFGTSLGLDNDWAYRIVKLVGNYGESFERNLGMGSPLKINRGLNALWTDGGLQYGIPIR